MIRAVVVSGWGAASVEVPTIDPALFPFVPHPGTLNVNLSDPSRCDRAADGAVPWFGYQAAWWHATVDGTPCVAIGVVADMPTAHKLELIAPVNLRSTLGVTDGDAVTIDLEVPCAV